MQIILSQLSISLIIFGACWIENPNKDYLKGFSISLSLIPSVFLLNWFEFLTENLVSALTILVGLTASTLYLLRFWEKTNKWNPLEIIKVIAVTQFSFAYIFLKPEQSGISLFILGFVFLSTRAAQLKSNKMIRNIIVVSLVLVMVFLIVYANIKASEAEKQTTLAMKALNMAKEQEQTMYKRMTELELQLDSLQIQIKKCQSGE